MRPRLKFRFLGYELRPAEASDIELARAWTAADPIHAGKIDPQFWVEQGRGVGGMELTYVLCSPHGHLLFLRMERVARFYIQFSPIENEVDRKRLREGLQAGMTYLAAALGAVGISEVLFDTTSAALRIFACRALGFAAISSDTLIRHLSFRAPKDEDEAEPGPKGNGAGDAETEPVEPQPIKLQGVQ